MPTGPTRAASVVITSNNSVVNLGALRNLVRNGVPVTLLSWNRKNQAYHSRYASRKVMCPNAIKSEAAFLNFLLDLGERQDHKPVLIPTSDREALLYARHRDALARFYIVPMASFEVVDKLVNKKKFYETLATYSVPHPKTYFPADIAELQSMAHGIDVPYFIKPAYSHLFREYYLHKGFPIYTTQDLDRAIEGLRDTNLEVMLQEIIPGNEIYVFYAYFDNSTEPIAICGYDKIRQNPPDFGDGSLCRSMWRNVPIDIAVDLLKNIGYHGLAEPEFKKDPRDGAYKLLEINARATTQNALAAACGVNMEYIAYRDALGQDMGGRTRPENGVVWIDEIGDVQSCWLQLRDRRLSIGSIVKSLRGKRVYARADWTDPLPLLRALYQKLFRSLVHKFLRGLARCVSPARRR